MKAPRITIRQNQQGRWMVCTGKGIYGTHITVAYLATAEAVKHVMKLLPIPCPLRHQLIDGLLKAESTEWLADTGQSRVSY